MRGYTELDFDSASASSELTQELESGLLTFKAKFALPGVSDMPWVEGVDGDGIGEYLVLYFEKKESVDVLRIHLGYPALYNENGRPEVLKFEFEGGESAEYTFDDVNHDFYIQLSRPIMTEWIKITIKSVYTGEKYKDTCISEIAAYSKD